MVQSRSQRFVPLDQRLENESSRSIHFEITMGNNRILVIRLTAHSQSASISCYGACLKWLLPELSFSDHWSRGTKLWERDWKWYGYTKFFRNIVKSLTSRSAHTRGLVPPASRSHKSYRMNWAFWLQNLVARAKLWYQKPVPQIQTSLKFWG